MSTIAATTVITKISYQLPDQPPTKIDDLYCWVAGQVHFISVAPPLLWGTSDDILRFMLQSDFPLGTKTPDNGFLYYCEVLENDTTSGPTQTLPWGGVCLDPNIYPNSHIDLPTPGLTLNASGYVTWNLTTRI